MNCEGSGGINDYSEFSGTIVCNNVAANVSTGAITEGRLLTTNGALTSFVVTVNMTPGCTNLGIGDVENSNKSIKLYPNPFAETLTIQVEETNISSIFTIYDVMGKEVMRKNITQMVTSMEVNLAPGMYFYKVMNYNRVIQTGKLISK